MPGAGLGLVAVVAQQQLRVLQELVRAAARLALQEQLVLGCTDRLRVPRLADLGQQMGPGMAVRLDQQRQEQVLGYMDRLQVRVPPLEQLAVLARLEPECPALVSGVSQGSAQELEQIVEPELLLAVVLELVALEQQLVAELGLLGRHSESVVRPSGPLFLAFRTLHLRCLCSLGS